MGCARLFLVLLGGKARAVHTHYTPHLTGTYLGARRHLTRGSTHQRRPRVAANRACAFRKIKFALNLQNKLHVRGTRAALGAAPFAK